MKIRIHPLFFLFALAMILLGQAVYFVCAFVAVLLHELSHALVAQTRGYKLREIVLLPYGAVLFGEENIERSSSVIIALAGPIANGVLALFTLACFWLFPESYRFLEPFLWANAVIGTVNLLPAFPLDGSRVVLGLSKNKLRALKILRAAGVSVSLAFLGLFIASAFFKINFTLGIFAVFLFLGATTGTEKEMYFSVADSEFKNYGEGVTERTVRISKDVNLYRVLKFLKPDYLTEFAVVSDGVQKRISEESMKKLLVKYPLATTLGDAMNGTAKIKTDAADLSAKATDAQNKSQKEFLTEIFKPRRKLKKIVQQIKSKRYFSRSTVLSSRTSTPSCSSSSLCISIPPKA